jgi:hypothetical protein
MYTPSFARIRVTWTSVNEACSLSMASRPNTDSLLRQPVRTKISTCEPKRNARSQVCSSYSLFSCPFYIRCCCFLNCVVVYAVLIVADISKTYMYWLCDQNRSKNRMVLELSAQDMLQNLHFLGSFSAYFPYFERKYKSILMRDRLCGLVVTVPGYRSRYPGFDSRRSQIFWEVVGLERGPLSLMKITEELLVSGAATFPFK